MGRFDQGSSALSDANVLRRLRVRDFGLISSADVAFGEGANVFTGETGSGKTMLVGALSFALGARSDAGVVRKGSEKALVELAFEPDCTLLERLNEDGFDVEPGEDVAIIREMSAAGKSSLRFCGRTVTAGFVREVAASIVEIVGQHEAQRLLSASYHLDVLDRFAGEKAAEARDGVARWHARAAEARDALEAHDARQQDALERLEQAQYAFDEIARAAPELGEDERLTMRRRYLDNVERVALALRAAHQAIAADDVSAVTALGSTAASLASVAGVSSELDAIGEQVAALQSESNDVATAIARALESAEYDPAELESINARLDLLDGLKRKYGSSLERVIAHAADAERLLSETEHRDERTAELRAALAEARRELSVNAERLGKLRRSAAAKLEKRVLAEFADLALGSGSFSVAFETLAEPGRNGSERVEFLFSANAGEAARPLARIVSGGELSRVLLALVVALAEARDGTTLVFDEVDAGIGGATAAAVGARLGKLARGAQILCVTHLAQLATWAERHYVLEKEERKGATTIGVREIAGIKERTSEIARMLSGESHDAALRHARELLAHAK